MPHCYRYPDYMRVYEISRRTDSSFGELPDSPDASGGTGYTSHQVYELFVPSRSIGIIGMFVFGIK